MGYARVWCVVFALALVSCSDDTTVKGDRGVAGDHAVVVGDKAVGEKGAVDRGPVADKGKVPDGAAGGCAASFAGCSNFEDKTGGTASITFGGAVGNSYSPKCVKVKVGQTVTFSGSFSTHPLAQSCGPAQVIKNGTGTETSFTFTVAGTYGFYCQVHGAASGSGMAGAIQVVP